eukprot:Nk52_evm1s2154 gene=Nk52_evmTU1s2154
MDGLHVLGDQLVTVDVHASIDEHQGLPVRRDLACGIVHETGGRRHDEPVDAAIEQRIDHPALHRLLVVAVTEHEDVARFARTALDRVEQRPEVGVGQAGDDEPD